MFIVYSRNSVFKGGGRGGMEKVRGSGEGNQAVEVKIIPLK